MKLRSPTIQPSSKRDMRFNNIQPNFSVCSVISVAK